jgi:hypothetical protein
MGVVSASKSMALFRGTFTAFVEGWFAVDLLKSWMLFILEGGRWVAMSARYEDEKAGGFSPCDAA